MAIINYLSSFTSNDLDGGIILSNIIFLIDQALKRWLPSVHESTINVILDGTTHIATGTVVILSYEMTVSKVVDLKRRNFQVIIAVIK